MDVWYALGTPTTGKVTASFSVVPKSAHIDVSRYSNVNTSSPIQAFAQANGNSAVPSAGGVAGTTKGESYMAVSCDNHAFSVGTGYTLISAATTANDGYGTERKDLVSTGTDTPTANTAGGVNWAAISLTMTPTPAIDPIIIVSYKLSGVAGVTTGTVDFSSSSDNSFLVNVTSDRAWVFGDVVNVDVIATCSTLGAAQANIDWLWLELIDTTGNIVRLSVWQGGRTVT